MNTERTTMNGKPVITLPSKTVLNMESGFKNKLLCDGPTFSTGTACAYSCSFCYVPAAMQKLVHDKLPEGQTHESVVILRENALETLYQQVFLQYVTKPTVGWWTLHQDLGAVLLGAASH